VPYVLVKFFNKEKSPKKSKAPERKDKVSVRWNIIMSWTPFLSIWAYMRIEKFWLGLLVNFGAYLFLIAVAMSYVWVTDDLKIDSSILGQMLVCFGIGGYITIHSYSVKIWSKRWNEDAERFNKELEEYNKSVNGEEKKDDPSKGVKL
jgi:hypothetical protein